MDLLIGTNNAGKVVEIGESLNALGVTLLTPNDLNISEVPDETGATYEDNAKIKAQFFHERSNGLPTIADDSGIVIDALQGELGVHTRRWGAGADATDQEWIDFFLERMNSESNKKARFLCCLCYRDANGTEQIFEGTCEGKITESLEADYLPGLPISACFKPDGYESVFSALSIDEKNAVSHRGRATQKLATYLEGSLMGGW